MAVYASSFGRWLVLGLWLGLFSCHSPDWADEVTGEVRGDYIYNYYCTSCHGKQGNAKISGASDLTKSSLTPDEVLKVILNGRGRNMPSYRNMIVEEEEHFKLVEFVMQLREE